MHGFVSVVRCTGSIKPDGTRQRMVVVQGQDFGRLWLIHPVMPQLANLEQSLLTAFQLHAAIGFDAQALSIVEFMRQLVERAMNPKLEVLCAFAFRQPEPLTMEATVPEGIIIPQQGAAIRPGPLWTIVAETAGRPRHEVFIGDREEGPVFVFRPAPFTGLNDKLVQEADGDHREAGGDLVCPVRVVHRLGFDRSLTVAPATRALCLRSRHAGGGATRRIIDLFLGHEHLHLPPAAYGGRPGTSSVRRGAGALLRMATW